MNLPLELAGVKMTRDEFLAAQRKVARKPGGQIAACVVVAVLLSALLLWLSWLFGGMERLSSTAIWLVTVVAVALVTRRGNARREEAALWQAYTAYAEIRGENTERVRFFGDHVETLGERRRMAVPYATIRRATERRDGFLLLWEDMIVSLPSRALTPVQADALRATLRAVLPPDRFTCKEPTAAALTAPIPVPLYPERPVTPPQALCCPPRRLEEAWGRAAFNTRYTVELLFFYTIVGLFTALFLDPQDVFLWADVLCVIAWGLLAQLAVYAKFRISKNPSPSRLVGLSVEEDGVLVYAASGETFLPKTLVAAQETDDALFVKTPLGPLYLPYDRMTDRGRIRQFLGLN